MHVVRPLLSIPPPDDLALCDEFASKAGGPAEAAASPFSSTCSSLLWRQQFFGRKGEATAITSLGLWCYAANSRVRCSSMVHVQQLGSCAEPLRPWEEQHRTKDPARDPIQACRAGCVCSECDTWPRRGKRPKKIIKSFQRGFGLITMGVQGGARRDVCAS